MDGQLRKKPNRFTPILGHAALFLVPAIAVFALVQKHFTGLPPRHLAEITFRIDPHLNKDDVSGSSATTPVGAMMDPQSVQREIRSRHKLKEAVQGLPLFERRNEDDRAHLLEQIAEDMRCKVERDLGTDSYLVTVSVTVPSNEPEQLEELLRHIRDVYLKHTIRTLVTRAQRMLESFRQQTKLYEDDYGSDERRLRAFEQQEDNKLLLGDPPPIQAQLESKRMERARLKNSESPDNKDLLLGVESQIIVLEGILEKRDSVLQQHSYRKEKRDKNKDRLEEHRKELAKQTDYVKLLQEKSRDRFNIVEGPTAQPVESEQSSRLIVGLALGAMAGLLMSLLYLLVRIIIASD